MKLNCTRIVLIFFLAANAITAIAQVSINAGDNMMEIGGMFSGYYNQRYNYIPTPNPTPNVPVDKSKNTFSLNNARLNIKGRYKNEYEYHLNVDFAQLGYTANGEFPPILAANFTYKGLKFVDAIVGYQQIPFSRSALISFQDDPFWQRGEVARGNAFSLRDVGITLTKSLWEQRINMYAGMYTGQGEYILTSVTGGANDPNGKFEYAGRVDVSFPSRYRYETYDTRHVPFPMFAVGVNGRYVERQNSLLGVADYNLKVIAGKKQTTGIDFTAQYQGFSFLFEFDQMNIKPTDTTLLQNKPTNFFKAGGTITQVVYYSKFLKSAFSVRYDEFIPNDLILNNTEKTLCFGYNFMLKGTRSMLKAQYWYRMVDRNNSLIMRNEDQVRVGWQYVF